MKYLITSPYLPHYADRVLAGGYSDNISCDGVYCSVCGEGICCGEEYYDVGGRFFCLRCEDAADEQILEEVRDSYLYEL